MLYAGSGARSHALVVCASLPPRAPRVATRFCFGTVTPRLSSTRSALRAARRDAPVPRAEISDSATAFALSSQSWIRRGASGPALSSALNAWSFGVLGSRVMGISSWSGLSPKEEVSGDGLVPRDRAERIAETRPVCMPDHETTASSVSLASGSSVRLPSSAAEG